MLKGLGVMPFLPLLPACLPADAGRHRLETDFFSSISPINRSLGGIAPQVFDGDDFTRPHAILWDKSAYINTLGGLPKPQRKTELAIIGGGISGLLSAYLLRDKNPILLEQASRFGGNAKAVAWYGLKYSIGAAYLVKPKADSAMAKIFNELGIAKDYAIKRGGEGHVLINGRLIENFWQAPSEPAHKATYQKLLNYFMSFVNEGGNPFPDYPTEDIALRQYINKLDTENFKSHLQRIIGSPLPSHLQTLLEHYCFSSLGGSSTEISAAAGINSFAGELEDIAVFPGGNAYIAEALLKRLHSGLPDRHLLPDSLVFNVKTQDDGVLVSYIDANNQPQSLLAEQVIMSCPKFVAAKLIDSLSAKKRAAISAMEYRAYLVANLLINRPIAENDYDLYCLGAGQADVDHVAAYAKSRGITDIINANYASPDSGKTVLSFYQAFPYHGGRAELYAQQAYQHLKSAISAQLSEEILPYYGLNQNNIADLRLTRWGHPLPLPKTGLLAQGIVDALRAPIDQHIFFIEQDNWALPAIETAVAEAVYWSSVIRSGNAPASGYSW